jgi:hypothetical protein
MGIIIISHPHHHHLPSWRQPVKSAASALDSGPQVVARGRAATSDRRGPCRHGGLARVVAGYRDVGICVSGRDRRGTDSLVIRGPDRVCE